MSNAVRTVGAGAPPVGHPLPGDDQALVHNDLTAVMTRDIPSVAHVLDIIAGRLGGPCGMRAASVFTLDPDDGSLAPEATRGDPGPRDIELAGQVFRVAAGAPPVRDGDRTALRLRIGGRTLGVLVLTGDTIAALRPEVAATIGLHLAATLQALAAEQDHQHVAHTNATIRALFEQGTAAATVEEAGRLLARATGEAFRTERAAVHLIGPDGRICYAAGVGLTERITDDLVRNLTGRLAAESPIWRAVAERGDGAPMLVDDVARADVRPGGFVQTMRLRSFVAMPLMSAAGPVGMVMCGDAGGPRRWTGRDHALARQVAMEGALIVDSARLRQAEQQHVAQLTRQAYHDPLTGLPNRTHLRDRAEQEVRNARTTGGRLALLLLDLDGFKRVNDTVGHHAGDALLQAVGLRLEAGLRGRDLVARLGGDEFAVLLTGDPDRDSALAAAGRLHARLAEPYDIDQREVRVGASIGVALLGEHGGDLPTLMRAADAAMYEAKRAGGGVRSGG
nr:sensor domain-containing diguanylate cyclase [Actinoplanes nipponensis]